jgi:hypothetical protein
VLRARLVPLSVRLALLAVVVPAAACGGGGNQRDGLEADTARFTWGQRSATVALTDCGREGDVVVLAGAESGLVVQVAADLSDGGAARTGVTGDMGGDDGIWGAFGDELDEGPVGEITRVATDGDRLTVEGRWALFDPDAEGLVPDSHGQVIDGKVVARCPAAEDEGNS